jgi:hypothetical protein
MMTAPIDPADGSTGDRYDRTIIVTGSDARYFGLACELIASIEQHRPGPVALGFYDLGLTDEQRDWLRDHDVITVKPQIGLTVPDGEDVSGKLAYLARPYLRENFPGFTVYIWLDADTWLQDWSGVAALQRAALATGAAVVRQDEKAFYIRPWLIGWQFKHFMLGYGVFTGLWLGTRAHINNGVFGMLADAPHWAFWHRRYQRAFDRTRTAGPHDQFSLNAAVYLDRLPTTFLPATCNWQCGLATPMWNAEHGKYCVPYAPFEPISVLHLAGSAKSQVFDIAATDGTSRHGLLRFAQGGEMQAATG